MHGYEDDLDEEAGYEDYYTDDDEGLEQEYEDDEEEDRPPPKEELEYLELRQKLKDSLRKKLGKGSASAQSSQEKRRKLPYNDFGSFFGPSRPVISSRVIQESKSLLENEIRTARTPSSNQTKKRPVPTNGSGTKNVLLEKRHKVVNEVRRKVATLKDARDYSFLLSDDADLPVPKKESLPRNGSIHNSEARPAQLSARPKQSSGVNGRAAHGPPREERRPISANGHSRQSSSGTQLPNSRLSSSGSQLPNSRPSSSGSQMHSRSVSGRPASSGGQLNSRPVSSGSQMQQRAASSGSQRPGSSTNRQAPMRPPGSTTNGLSANNRDSQQNSRLDSQRSVLGKAPLDHHRKQMSSRSNGAGPDRSASMARSLPSKTSLERKPSISAGKSSLQNGQRPSSSRPMSSDPRQRVEQRKVPRDPGPSRVIPKQSAPTGKHQVSRPGLKRPPARDIDDDDRRLKKKKPARMSEDDMAFDMIRKMFKTDRFAGRDDDDINMEANWDDIMKEERRSARIAKVEDEEQLRLIEEEEKRERMRKEKNRKLR